MLKDKRILITGGGGSIGSELARQLSQNNILYLLDINETAVFDLIEELRLEGKEVQGRVGNIRTYTTVFDAFNIFKPEYIFHTAALKHVTPNEWNPEEAVQTNVMGTLNVIKAAKRLNVEKLVNISTDKVCQANSIMGMTKRLGELIVKNAGYISVRFGNVLGSRGSVIPIWQKEIENNQPLTVTHPEMMRYFMTIQEACQLVIEATLYGNGGEIVILDMGQPVNILELAKEILKKSEKELDIKFIGIRKGETLLEQLMTEEEQRKAVKNGKFWIIK